MDLDVELVQLTVLYVRRMKMDLDVELVQLTVLYLC